MLHKERLEIAVTHPVEISHMIERSKEIYKIFKKLDTTSHSAMRKHLSPMWKDISYHTRSKKLATMEVRFINKEKCTQHYTDPLRTTESSYPYI